MIYITACGSVCKHGAAETSRRSCAFPRCREKAGFLLSHSRKEKQLGSQPPPNLNSSVVRGWMCVGEEINTADAKPRRNDKLARDGCPRMR